MRYLPTGAMMKQADDMTIHTIGIPSLVLMERAALQCVAILQNQHLDCSHILVVCGTGNNGGDGMAIARLLYLKGYKVTVVLIGNRETCTIETRTQIGILEKCGLSIGDSIPCDEYSMVIDAIFGVGLSRTITGGYARNIEQINQISGVKVAIDIPSGIESTSGKVLGIAVKADLTIALAYEKLGTTLHDGYGYSGRVIPVEIGIEDCALPQESPIPYTYEKKDLPKLLPKRTINSNKGTYGKVLMIVGSMGMSGAAYLSAKAAYAVGAGLVRIYTVEENRVILQQLLPEAVLTTYTQYEESEVASLLAWAEVVAIGSGLGKSNISSQILLQVLRDFRGPCVVDADGLNWLAKQETCQIFDFKQVVLTPHMKEMAGLLHCEVLEVLEHRLEMLERCINLYGGTCVLKDARTMVLQKKTGLYINCSGCGAMSKAGTGDVLTGMIAGFMAQGVSSYKSATLGVYLHGLAGEVSMQKKGCYSVLASDIIEQISTVLKDIRSDIIENI
ncbi:MAG: NAD(P)H-hydrate dehydratase [Lachnospiraceae bacterium]